MTNLNCFTFAVLLFAIPTSRAVALPRDELLRVAPTDAAVVILVQNVRQHYHNLSESPFVQWFPSTAIGKKILESADLKQLRESSGMIFSELGTSPDALIEDVLGEAVAFAFTPASSDRPNDERAVILIRPRKPEVLSRLIEKMNDLQIRSGELKGVVSKQNGGVTYLERQKAGNGAEYYCFRGDVFAFSGIEAEIKSFIDRDKTEAKLADKSPELLERLKKLGIEGAAG